jgi:chloramphenicol 3-O-phosphotransferase
MTSGKAVTRILLLSGPLAVGKSSVAAALIATDGFMRLASGTYLQKYAAERDLPIDRAGLQSVGDTLDVETDYLWLIDDVAAPAIATAPYQDKWLVDAVRKQRQVDHFRRRFGDSVLHVHLTADDSVLRRRYEERARSGDATSGRTSYDLAIRHPNETAARVLIAIADLVVDVSALSPLETAEVVIKRLDELRIAKVAPNHSPSRRK